MSKILCPNRFAFGSAHEKFDVWTGPNVLSRHWTSSEQTELRHLVYIKLAGCYIRDSQQTMRWRKGSYETSCIRIKVIIEQTEERLDGLSFSIILLFHYLYSNDTISKLPFYHLFISWPSNTQLANSRCIKFCYLDNVARRSETLVLLKIAISHINWL